MDNQIYYKAVPCFRIYYSRASFGLQLIAIQNNSPSPSHFQISRPVPNDRNVQEGTSERCGYPAAASASDHPRSRIYPAARTPVPPRDRSRVAGSGRAPAYCVLFDQPVTRSPQTASTASHVFKRGR